MGRRSRQRTRSLVAILVVLVASWVLPVQACAGLAAAPHSSCPDCPAPCCQHGCCPGVATACTVSMPSLAVAYAPSSQHSTLVPAGLLGSGFQPQPREVAAAPVERPPVYSPPSALSIRFCSFQD